MVKSELIQKIAEDNPHLRKEEVVVIVETVFDAITGKLASGGRVEIRGFGAFSLKERGARAGRNPRTGEGVEVEGKVVPFFRPSKQLLKRLNI